MVELDGWRQGPEKEDRAASRQKDTSCVTAPRQKHQLECFCDCHSVSASMCKHILRYQGCYATSHFSTGWFLLPWELKWTTHSTCSASFPSSFSARQEPGSSAHPCPSFLFRSLFLPVLQENKWPCVPLRALQLSTETPLPCSRCRDPDILPGVRTGPGGGPLPRDLAAQDSGFPYLISQPTLPSDLFQKQKLGSPLTFSFISRAGVAVLIIVWFPCEDSMHIWNGRVFSPWSFIAPNGGFLQIYPQPLQSPSGFTDLSSTVYIWRYCKCTSFLSYIQHVRVC